MIIKNYSISNKRRDLIVDIEIEDIQWNNDSIGWYEYWGSREFDHRPDYVESFTISEIYYKNKKIRHKKIIEFLSEILYEDEDLYNKIEEMKKIDIESDKVERLLERREYQMGCV